MEFAVIFLSITTSGVATWLTENLKNKADRLLTYDYNTVSTAVPKRAKL